MKAFFSKIWTWIVGHKVVSIIISAVLVAGVTCAIVLPIALKHEHSFGTELEYDDTHHYYICDECGGKKDKEEHDYSLRVTDEDFLKASATPTSKAQYWKSCKCGKASTTAYFEVDKIPANLQVSDISKTYDGTPVAEPTVTFDGVSAKNFEYYKGNEKLTGRPTDAGTYKVVVTVAETNTHAGDRVEREFTIAKKTLNYLELTKVYDGAGFIDYALGTEHGIVSGDVVVLTCDEEFDYDVGNYYFIDKTDDVSITDVGIDRAFLDGADAGNYQFANQKVSGLDEYEMGGMLTVTKRPVWAENVKFIYDGSTCWTGEESPEEIVFQNVVAGETIDSSFIEWEFRAKDVRSDLVSVDDGEYYANYDFDLSKCSASIVPKPLSGSLILDIYYGDVKKLADSDLYYYDQVIPETEYGVVTGDSVTVRVLYENPNAGTANTSFAIYGTSNYTIGDLSVNNTTISQKIVTELPATLTAEYKGMDGLTEGLEAPVEIDGVEATLIFNAKKSDNNNLYNPGTYTNATIIKASLGDNFDLQIDATAKYTITVTPKKLSALDIKITEAQYNKGEFTLVSSKDGVYAPVEVTFSKANYQDVAVDAVFDLIIDEDLFMQGREVIAFADSEYAKTYQFVPDANGIVGTITIVENCDVQYDGSCNCGTSHLTETLTFTGGEAVGKSATIACDSTYEGGIYKIALEGGKYEFFGTDQFFNISGIYDVNGNKLANSIGTYILPKGTYYFHVYVGSSPSSDTIWVKKTAEYCSFETARVFECQTDETDSFTLSAGDKLYLKIMGGANSKLNDFEIDGDATFTLALYNLTNTTTPYHVEEDALSNYYWDICETSDFYVVLTCVTAGDINLSAAK